MAINRDLSSPLTWRRSLRASHARRVQRARRRRLTLRGRAGLTLAIVLSAVAAGGAVAQDVAAPLAPGVQNTDTVRALQQKLGISADGAYGPKTRAAVKRFQRAHGLVADGVAGARTLAALGVTSAAPEPEAEASDSSAAPPGGADGTLQRIAQCESGGSPTAVSADGTYRGKYQFTRTTWREMGGNGDPADAPEAEQDRIAAQLLAQRGTAPWPVCGGG